MLIMAALTLGVSEEKEKAAATSKAVSFLKNVLFINVSNKKTYNSNLQNYMFFCKNIYCKKFRLFLKIIASHDNSIK